MSTGSLAPSQLFDTVSYGPNNANMATIGGHFPARHDVVGLGGANCASADCNGNSGTSCYVTSYEGLLDPARPTGCYAGSNGPPAGGAPTSLEFDVSGLGWKEAFVTDLWSKVKTTESTVSMDHSENQTVL